MLSFEAEFWDSTLEIRGTCVGQAAELLAAMLLGIDIVTARCAVRAKACVARVAELLAI